MNKKNKYWLGNIKRPLTCAFDLRQERINHGWPISYLAEKSGLSWQKVYIAERGYYSYFDYRKLVKALAWV
jgi:hypothetical protein